MYITIKATVNNGQIELLENVHLPENAKLLITLLETGLDDTAEPELFTLGEHIVAGLQDIAAGQYTTVHDATTLEAFLAEIV
jgi:hypothetical protein